MRKKLTPAVLCLVLLLVMMFSAVPAAAASYQGASSWAVPELDKADGYGLITERIKGNMAGSVTREEFAEIGVRLYETYTGTDAATGSIAFSDTQNPEILKAANLGLVTGIGGDRFGPDLLLTREQMATILFRALRVINPTADFSSAGTGKFNDDASISSWARDGVYYCFKAGIINGIGGSKFGPGLNSTREAAVLVSVRTYERYKQAGSSEAPAVQTPQDTVGFSWEVFKRSIESLNSYSRKINVVTTAEESGSVYESYKQYAYVKNPLSTYTKLEYPDTEAYLEEIIIGDKSWTRLSADEQWTVWDSFESEKPVTFRYDDLNHYPILYEKLTFVKTGTEQVSGINCNKYTISGTYQDEYGGDLSSETYPMTLTASGSVWVADDAAVKQAVIRQRITIETDIEVKGNHYITTDTIEDDITKINSTVIQPPADSNIAAPFPAQSEADGNTSADGSLVGTWSSEGPSGNMVDPSTGMTEGSYYNGTWYLFREDGTFRMVMIGSGSIISGAVVQEGKYTADNGELKLTDVKESWYPDPAASGQTPAYKNKSTDGGVYSYELEDNGGKLKLIDQFSGSELYYRVEE